MNCVKNGGNLVMIEQNHTVIVPLLICQSFQWEYKLDQETWLCRTHLDDFLVKILTILDHTRTRLNLVIKAILLNLW